MLNSLPCYEWTGNSIPYGVRAGFIVESYDFIPKDKAGEIMKLAKEWAKTALTASGEVDKAKGSLKEYLVDHLDELDTSNS